MNVDVFLDSLSVGLSCFGVLFSLSILFFIFIRIRPLKSNVPLILTCNTYVTSLTSSIIIFRSNCQTLYRMFHPIDSLGYLNCQISGYFIYIAFGNVIYSLVLHAFYRLARIVFYQKKSLYSQKLFSIAIIIQWILIFLINLPFLLLDYLDYIPTESRCQVSYANFRASLLVLIIEYSIPSNILFTIYFQIIRYIRRTNNRMRNRHDLVILKQLIVIFVITQCLSAPLLILWFVYIGTNTSSPLIYQLQTLSVAFSQSFIPIILAIYTPQIREKFQWNRRRRTHPMIREAFHRNEPPLRTIPHERF